MECLIILLNYLVKNFLGGRMSYIYILVKQHDTRGSNYKKKISVHPSNTEKGSPLSIFTGFFKIIGGDGEGLEGGGGKGGDM